MTFKSALASQDFIEYIWKNDELEFFVDLMKRTLLMSEWNFNKERYYLVPSLLRDRFQGSHLFS